MSATKQPHNENIREKAALAAQILSLRVAYHKLATRYRNFSLLLRRDVQQDRTNERFHCAALFQHLPAAFQTGGDGKEGGSVAQPDATLPVDEVCPVSRGWYKRLVSASESLDTWPDNESRGIDQATIRGHILWAEISLYHAEHLLDSIVSQLPLTYGAPSPITMIMSWNRLCEGVKADLARDAAVKAARDSATDGLQLKAKGLPGSSFVRTWFNSEQSLPTQLPPALWLAQLRKTSTTPPEPTKPANASSSSRPSADYTSYSASGSSWGGYDQWYPYSMPFGSTSTPLPPLSQHRYGASTGFGYSPTKDDELPRALDTPFERYFGRPPDASPFTREGQGYGESHSSGRGGSRPSTGRYTSYPSGREYGPHSNAQPSPDPTSSSEFPDQATSNTSFTMQTDRLERYNNRWDALEPTASHRTIPYPSRMLNLTTLAEQSHHGLSQLTIMTWAVEDHMKVNAAKFWAEGCGVELRIRGGQKTAEIGNANAAEDVKALRKQLRMKEALRWHPDSLNRRTGEEEGGTDESIGKRKEMKAIWSTLQDLVVQCEKFGE